jgi:hypothetical protein
MIKNNLNPSFVKTITIDYLFEENQDIQFTLYDIDSSSAQYVSPSLLSPSPRACILSFQTTCPLPSPSACPSPPLPSLNGKQILGLNPKQLSLATPCMCIPRLNLEH